MTLVTDLYNYIVDKINDQVTLMTIGLTCWHNYKYVKSKKPSRLTFDDKINSILLPYLKAKVSYRNMLRAVKSNILDNVLFFYHKGINPRPELVYFAKNSQILQWLMKQKYQLDSKVFDLAAKGGNKVYMQTLFDNKCPQSNRLIDISLQKGHFGNIKWLLDANAKMTNNTLKLALSKGQMKPFVNHVWSKKYVGCYLYNIPIQESNLKSMDYLFALKCPLSRLNYNMAKKRGNPLVLKWLLDRNCPGS